jgi:hypothetical protein
MPLALGLDRRHLLRGGAGFIIAGALLFFRLLPKVRAAFV